MFLIFIPAKTNVMEKTRFITDANGKKISVVLPIKEYEHMLELLEEKEDIRLYDEVKARKEKTIPLDDYLEKRKKRKHG